MGDFHRQMLHVLVTGMVFIVPRAVIPMRCNIIPPEKSYSKRGREYYIFIEPNTKGYKSYNWCEDEHSQLKYLAFKKLLLMPSVIDNTF